MKSPHWTEQDMIDHLYGIGPAADHLDECVECRVRWNGLAQRRAEILREPEVSHEFLSAQRRSIYNRLGRGPAERARWIPAFAAVLLVLLGLFVFRPDSKAPDPVIVSSADSQLFSDILALEQNTEPEAVSAIHALFEEGQ